eukprot:IDg23450t1
MDPGAKLVSVSVLGAWRVALSAGLASPTGLRKITNNKKEERREGERKICGFGCSIWEQAQWAVELIDEFRSSLCGASPEGKRVAGMVSLGVPGL